MVYPLYLRGYVAFKVYSLSENENLRAFTVENIENSNKLMLLV